MILIIILYALFALSVVISKKMFDFTAPIFYIGARMSLAGMLLLAYQYIYARKDFHFKREHFWLYAQVVFFGIYFTYIIRFWGLKYLPASKAMFMFNLAPFLSALFSYIFLNEEMSRKKWLGLCIGVIGFIPILISPLSPIAALNAFWNLLTTTPKITEGITPTQFGIPWPELAVLASVISHSYNWIVIRKLVRDNSYSPAMINGLTMFVGGICALITSPYYEGLSPVTNFLEFAKLLACVILISNLICHNLYAYLLKVYTATFLSFAGFMSPLFAALYGWLWLSEKITPHFYVSSVIVFIGLLLFYQDEMESIKQEIPEILE